MKQNLSDIELYNKGFYLLLKNLGYTNTIRFVSKISESKDDYLKIKENIFKNKTIKEIFTESSKFNE
ncbi:MAG: hypothetical protein U9R23_01670 [Candidatus Cloacimonadota bacterium]|nr:hypothetical protein [Candidatus Cloacimonadota bacterium]